MKKSLVKWIIGVAVGVALSGMTVCAEDDPEVLRARPIPSTNIVEHYDNKIMYGAEQTSEEYYYRPILSFYDEDNDYWWIRETMYNMGYRVLGLTDSGYYVTEGWSEKGHFYHYIPKHLLQDTPQADYIPVDMTEVAQRLAELEAIYPTGSLYTLPRHAIRFDIEAKKYVFGEDRLCKGGLSMDAENINIGDTLSIPRSIGWGQGIVTDVADDYIIVGYADWSAYMKNEISDKIAVMHWNVKISIDELKREGLVIDKSY